MARPEGEKRTGQADDAFGDRGTRASDNRCNIAEDFDGVGGRFIDALFAVQALLACCARTERGQHNQCENEQ